MKLACLYSGGKLSTYALLKAMSLGHDVICLASIISRDPFDSSLFQTAGTPAIPAIAKAMNIPLVARPHYLQNASDEIGTLQELLYECKCRYPDLQGVLTGVTIQDYKRLKFEQAAARLGLSSFAPLWRKDSQELFNEISSKRIESILVQIQSQGFTEGQLGTSISDDLKELLDLKERYQTSILGQHGEFQNIVVDGPNFTGKIHPNSARVQQSGSDAFVPHSFFDFGSANLQSKENGAEEEIPIPEFNTPRIFTNLNYFFTGEISAKTLNFNSGNTVQGDGYYILKALQTALRAHSLSLRDIHYVTVYIKDMSQFVTFNAVYSHFFNFEDPPARVCVGVADQQESVKIAVKGAINVDKVCTQVQSINNWAPASVGPYSQSYKVGNAVHLAGNLNFDPITMEFTQDVVGQIVKNSQAIAGVYNKSILRPEVCIAYYSKDPFEISHEYEAFPVKVTHLPKGAELELEFHLQDAPPLINLESRVDGEGFQGRIVRKESSEIFYLSWQITFESIENVQNMLRAIKQQLDEYANNLGEPDVLSKLVEVRVFLKNPLSVQNEPLNAEWLNDVPAVFIKSETEGMILVGKNYEKLGTINY